MYCAQEVVDYHNNICVMEKEHELVYDPNFKQHTFSDHIEIKDYIFI